MKKKKDTFLAHPPTDFKIDCEFYCILINDIIHFLQWIERVETRMPSAETCTFQITIAAFVWCNANYVGKLYYGSFAFHIIECVIICQRLTRVLL